MALANFVSVAQAGGAPGQPVYLDVVRLDLDSSYPAGGYDLAEGTADRTALNAIIGNGRTILAIVQQEQQQEGAAGIAPYFDFAATKLQIFVPSTGVEISGDLSNITGFDLLVFSK